MPKTLPTTERTLEHFIRSLVFRFQHVTARTPEGFGDFEAGGDVRSPRTIVRHMSGLLSFALNELEGEPRVRLEALSWDEECLRFVATAAKLDDRLQQGLEVGGEVTLDRLFRGPMIDAMTHIGQLATLRRLAGSPVDAVNYWKAEMPSLNEKNMG